MDDVERIVAERAALREHIIHGLHMQGWSRIDAENEADDRLDTLSKGEAQCPTRMR